MARKNEHKSKGSYQLGHQELPAIVNHYQKKFGIRIIIDRVNQQQLFRSVLLEQTKEDQDIVEYFKRRWMYPAMVEFPHPPNFDPIWKPHEKMIFAAFVQQDSTHADINDIMTLLNKIIYDGYKPTEDEQKKLEAQLNEAVKRMGINDEVHAAIENGKHGNIVEYFKYMIGDLRTKYISSRPFAPYPHLDDPFAFYAPELKRRLESAGFLKDGQIRTLSAEEHLALRKILDSAMSELGIHDAFYQRLDEANAAAKRQKAFLDANPKSIDRAVSNYAMQDLTMAFEVKHIQEQLKEGEAVGYINTTHMDETSGKGHAEVLIITKDQIIKPVEWNVNDEYMISTQHFPELVTVLPMRANHSLKIVGDDFRTEKNKEGVILPQSGDSECATLGILFLKELLKDGGKQLREESLSFKIYALNAGEPELHSLFVPPPQVLRYSQSSTYNKAVYNFIQSSDEEATIEHQGKMHSIKTLEKLLNDSIAIAQQKGDLKVVAENKRLLELLPSFREKWKKAYEAAMEERKAMNDEKLINRYLEYKTTRMGEHAEQERASTAKMMHTLGATKAQPAPTVVAAPPVVAAPQANPAAKPAPAAGISKYAVRVKRETPTQQPDKPDADQDTSHKLK